MLFIQTFTGRKFYPLNPRAEDVCIEDIAHALSGKGRFNCHTTRFWPVAAHSLLVSRILEPAGLYASLVGLLHDAGEAYLPDVAATIKECVVLSPAVMTDEHKLLGFPMRIGVYEEKILLPCIFQGLGVAMPSHEVTRMVHEVDKRVCATERIHVMAEVDWDWQYPWEPFEDSRWGDYIRTHWNDRIGIEREFLRRFRELSAALKAAA